jgi:signal transduction histidine kinase
LYNEIYQKGHIRMEVTQYHKNGRKLTIDLKVSALQDEIGNIIFTVGVSQDITAQKKLAEQTHKHTLERERVNLLQTLIQDIAHDLKNPIATIKTQLYMANRSLDMPEKKPRNYLESAEAQVNHLAKILEDFLDMSKLDRDEMVDYLEFQFIDLHELIQTIINEHQLQITKKSQTILLTPAKSIIAYVDPINFSRVISNLLINAINYTLETGDMHIHIQQTQEQIIIEVHDTGIGIAEDELQNIFNRFYRGDKSRTGLYQSGSGLGLSIVQRIVELHQGTIEVESQLNLGSTFRIIIPRKHFE